MSHQNSIGRSFHPVISILIVILSLFIIVFVQMEERRMGYEVLQLTKEHRRVHEEKRVKSLQLTRLMRPQNVERLAHSRSSMRKVLSSQIIHLTGTSIPHPTAAANSVDQISPVASVGRTKELN